MSRKDRWLKLSGIGKEMKNQYVRIAGLFEEFPNFFYQSRWTTANDFRGSSGPNTVSLIRKALEEEGWENKWKDQRALLEM